MDYTKIKNLIRDRLLDRALNEIRNESDSRYAADIENIEMTYQFMKDYMLNNVDDPQRGQLYDSLLARAYDLLNRVVIDEESANSNEIFYQKLRYYRTRQDITLEILKKRLEDFSENMAMDRLLNGDKYSMDNNLKHEKDASDLFYMMFTNTAWTEKDRQDTMAIFESVQVSDADKMLAMSGILLSLMKVFDIRKYLLVMRLCTSPDAEVSARACVVFLAVSQAYDDIIGLYAEARDAIYVLEENSNFKMNLYATVIQFLKTLDTKEIDKKFNEEIIPELIRKQSEMKDKLGTGMIDEEKFNELNPEWKKDMEESGLTDKLKEISEWQQEGFDVYMGTFSKLKSFTFFRELSNWFCQFTLDNTEINRLMPGIAVNRSSYISAFLGSRILCDSDKYSFCLMMAQVPESQRGMMMAQMDDNPELKAAFEGEGAKQKVAGNLYIQDLYRFYNLYPARHEFRSIFDHVADLTDIKILSSLMNDPAGELSVAEFLFRKSHYELAYRMFRRYLDSVECTSSQIFQKAGFAAQRIGKYDEAIILFTNADSITPNNTWVLSHIASCYIMSNDLSKAIEYYTLVELIEPDNLDITLQKCKCYIRMKEFATATELLYKVYFMRPDNMTVLRMLGWSLMQTGAKEDALKYYEKIGEDQSKLSANDCANIGHALWINGRVRDAAEKYAICLEKGGMEIFQRIIEDDSELLKKNGIKSADIAIMKDIVLSKPLKQ